MLWVYFLLYGSIMSSTSFQDDLEDLQHYRLSGFLALIEVFQLLALSIAAVRNAGRAIISEATEI